MHALSFFTVSKIVLINMKLFMYNTRVHDFVYHVKKILIINSNDNTPSGQSENGLTFKCDFLESLCSRCKDVCDGSKLSRIEPAGVEVFHIGHYADEYTMDNIVIS